MYGDIPLISVMQDLVLPEGYGWEVTDGNLTAVLMTKELTTCQFERSECSTNP